MDRSTIIKRGVLAASVLALTAYGCERPNPYKLSGDTSAHEDCPPINPSGGQGANGQGAAPGTGGAGGTIGPQSDELDERELDYSEALRVASLKLVGTLPTLDQVYAMADEPEETKPDLYSTMLDDMMNDPRFDVLMIEYWRAVFKQFGDGIPIDDDDDDMTPALAVPSREFAPVFAARMVVEGRPWTDLLTASTDNCPTYDDITGTFVSGDCTNITAPVGVLSDPGTQSLYYGNLAFRRNRHVHEVFLCRSGNAPGGAEPTDTPSDVGPCGQGAPPDNYNSPWPMDSISGECSSAPVDFHEYNATTVCANCHSTWNHRAPLLANFDAFGMDQGTPQVLVPVEGAPLAVREDWLPVGEPTAWKFGMPAASLAELGTVMAGDPAVIECGVKRMWNYAMSRGDIVDRETPVPGTVVAPFIGDFETSNYNMRQVLKDIMVSDDFVRF
jgi:hypothetical protein